MVNDDKILFDYCQVSVVEPTPSRTRLGLALIAIGSGIYATGFLFHVIALFASRREAAVPGWYDAAWLVSEVTACVGAFSLILGVTLAISKTHGNAAFVRGLGAFVGCLLGGAGIAAFVAIPRMPAAMGWLEANFPWSRLYLIAPSFGFLTALLLVVIPFHAARLNSDAEELGILGTDVTSTLCWGLVELVLISPIGVFAVIFSIVAIMIFFLGLIPLALILWMVVKGWTKILQLMIGESLRIRASMDALEPQSPLGTRPPRPTLGHPSRV